MAKNDFDDLLKELEKDIGTIMQTTGDKKIKQIYKKHAEESYDTYEPTYNRSRYRHGESGSFADEENFKSTIHKQGNRLEYELHNDRETDCQCEDCRAKRYKLDMFIEDGWAGKYRIQPKDVYEKAQDEIDEEFEGFLNNELSRRGW